MSALDCVSLQEAASMLDAPFAFVSSIPISASTIRGMRGKRSVTSAVVPPTVVTSDRRRATTATSLS